MKQSSGTLLYRRRGAGWEVLIVRPSGPAARSGWSIPKGLPDPGEELEAAARRETLEEAGVSPGALEYLGYSDYQKSKKRVHCFAGPAGDAEPKAASWEVSEARFVALEEAAELLHRDQRIFAERLFARLSGR
jgi:predicted NUDIX family NTP pyrophosphohydrolase